MAERSSRTPSSIPFEKWDATGNDFLLIDLEGSGLSRAEITPELVRELCSRGSGPGADGVFLFNLHPNQNQTKIQAEIINSDGTSGAMCGNALRCLAQVLRQKTGQHEHWVQLGERTVEVSALDQDNSSVNLGQPDHLEGYTVFENVPSFEALLGQRGHLLSFGNPHFVVPHRTIPQTWTELGERLQPLADKLLRTGGINCGFLEISESNSDFPLMVFERGAGPTLSCGSGTCAASAVLQHVYAIEPPHQFRTPGGCLQVRRKGEDYLLIGQARRVEVGIWSKP